SLLLYYHAYTTTSSVLLSYIFFCHPPTHSLSTLSLHDALPISRAFFDLAQYPNLYLKFSTRNITEAKEGKSTVEAFFGKVVESLDRKSTRLNSSHLGISYAVFCLKKKTTSPKVSRFSLYRAKFS